MNYNGEEVLALHFTIDEDLSDIMSVCNQILDKCREAELAVLPKLFKCRDSFPLNKGGKMDMVAMANESEGFIIMNSR